MAAPPNTEFDNSCTSLGPNCPVDFSNYNYLPSLPANAIFLAIFSFSMLCYILQSFIWRSRRALVFAFAMICGTMLEILGYAGRLINHHNPFDTNGFLIQIVCLTIAPAFMAGGIYFCLRSIVDTFGAKNSRLAPKSYTRIFIPCDVVSLILQAAGGALASIESQNNESTETGSHVMVAGLSFQVATLLAFIALCGDFTLTTIRRMNRLGETALDPEHAKLRASFKFRGFCIALTVATLCIFTRSVYRVIELAEGWNGAIISNQGLFIGLEGVLVSIAALLLNVFHPAFCFEGF